MELAKLTGSDAGTLHGFGSYVGVDNDTAVIGEWVFGAGALPDFSAYVFTRSGGRWTEQAKLTPSGDGDFFGVPVAISGDTIVAGGLGDSGEVRVFTRSGGVWSEQATLTASDAAPGDSFGISVAISGDTAVIGAGGDDDAGNASGSAYVFTRSAGVWTQQAKLTASDAAATDFFGNSVAISGDTVVVGANQVFKAPPGNGAAYVFTRSAGVWTQQAKLTASDGAASDAFGLQVAVNGDTAVVGAGADDDAGESSGSVYVFARSGGIWTQQAKLTASDAAAGDGFGRVAISGDTVVVGAPGDDDAGVDSGAAYVFTRTAGVWTEKAKVTASDAAAGDGFGSVAVSGNTALIGASGDDDFGEVSGAAYVYSLVTNELTLEDVPVPTGDDVPIISIPNFFVQAADSVVVAGTVDASFCVGHDPRYRVRRGRTQFSPRPFRISEMSHTGSCGDLSLFREIVPANYYGYPGRFPADETGVSGVWFVVADIKAEGAIFNGPLVAAPSAEAVIDFTDPLVTPNPPACNTDLRWRQLILGGDFENGQRVMTVDSVQCNAPRSMTRRTTYLYPVRLESTPRTSRVVELINMQRHFVTIGQGIKDIRRCAANETVSEIWQNLLYAQLAFVFGRREEALEYLEQGAFAAKNGNFNGCPPEQNDRGRLMADLLSGAFNVFDRYLRPNAGGTWEIYRIPAELELPLVTTDAPPPVIP